VTGLKQEKLDKESSGNKNYGNERGKKKREKKVTLGAWTSSERKI